MIGYKNELKEYAKELEDSKVPLALRRLYLEGFKHGYAVKHRVDKDFPYLNKPDPFKVTSGDFKPRDRSTQGKGYTRPRVTPFEADPDYTDPKEPKHEKGDLQGVKQYPVTLTTEDIKSEIKFDIKSKRLMRSVTVLELRLGYDHKTNSHVLYSPLKYNERWDQQSQVIWLRTIGMSPLSISKRLDIKYDTVKNWLRALKNQPLVATSQHDWAVKQVDGRGEYSTKFSSVEAKPRSVEAKTYI